MVHYEKPQQKSIRVLHLIDSLGGGGAQQILLDLVANWPADGWSLEVIGLHGMEPYGSRIRQAGIPVRVLADSRLHLPKILLGLERHLRRNPPDILHCHLGIANLLGMLLRPPLPSLGTVLHDHSGEEFTAGGLPVILRPFLRPLEKRLWAQADRVLCVSRAIVEFNKLHRGLDEDKLTLLGNAVRLNRFPGDRQKGLEILGPLGLAPRATVVGGVGRFVAYKGFDVMLRAFAPLAGEFPHAQLVLVGDGPERGSLAELAKSLGLADRVLFTGYQSAIPDLMAAMDVLVCPSRIESFGIVGVEALASGVPVVATRVGGIPDYIEHGVHGLLVDSDDVEGMSRAIGRCQKNPDEAQAMAERGNRRVRAEYSMDNYIRTIEGVYREILAIRKQNGIRN